MTGNETRQAFIDYFVSKNHRRVRSSNLIPSADPTLLFTNAGMVPFKDTFLGREKRDYSRAVSSQKCLRVSGKHNDLDEVGRTNRHNTFFEMLGNFSFGDYFKREAVEYAWEFLTEVVKLSPDKLWITVFRDDDEAGRLWPEIAGVPESRVVRLGEKDNFWSMGPTGPCGPCSEIYIDHGEGTGCGRPECAPGCECDRYEEIWNLVFMQYDRDQSGKLNPLPDPSIDTGMGLERLASVLQGVESNFDTDLIRPIIERAEDVLEKPYGVNSEDDIAFRVIGDHMRATAFLVTEGVLPSNDDRGYVLRRLMRRAMRYGKMLGAHDPFLYRVIGAVIDNFRSVYPELAEAEKTMARIVEVEEEKFGRTLESGLRILNEIVEKARAVGVTAVDGKEIFRLYDTYGFPLDLAGDILGDAGMTFGRDEYEEELQRQRTLARGASKMAGVEIPEAYRSIEDESTLFLGYEYAETSAEVIAVIKDGAHVESLNAGDSGEIVLDKTVLYAESGGQAGDTGEIVSETGRAKVTETKKPLPSLVSHHVEITDGEIGKGQKITARIDSAKREATKRNHTATHLLQSALRQVLGEHVKQSGSYVGPDKLRFDFSHFAPVSSAELREVERIVNEKIRDNIAVSTKEMDTEDAITEGATALFGEKYGAKVRVVDVPGFSRELCGGTHAAATGQIGFLKITAETGVAAGIRRIEAVTGEGALEYLLGLESGIRQISSLLKCPPDDSPARVIKLIEANRELEKQIKKIRQEKARGAGGADMEEREIAGIKVTARKFEGLDTEALRSMVDETKTKLGSGVVLAATVEDGKVVLVAGVTKDLVGRLHAGKIAKQAAAIVGGGGGGRPDMAQAGGTDASKVDEALKSVFDSVQNQIG